MRWLKPYRREVKDDDVLTLAAGFAYHLVFALVPLMLLLVSTLAMLPSGMNVERRLEDLLARFMPGPILDVLREQIIQIVRERDFGLFTAGTLLVIWSASSATRSAIKCLNRAFDVKETRKWWRVRIRSILLTFAIGTLLVGGLTLVAFGPRIVQRVLDAADGGASYLPTLWQYARWPAAILVVALAAAILYYYGPNRKEARFRWFSPGSAGFAIAWIAASHAIAQYARSFNKFNETYGVLGAVMFLLLWFYWTGLALLLGGEADAVLEQVGWRAALGIDPPPPMPLRPEGPAYGGGDAPAPA
jgi:membrane protein